MIIYFCYFKLPYCASDGHDKFSGHHFRPSYSQFLSHYIATPSRSFIKNFKYIDNEIQYNNITIIILTLRSFLLCTINTYNYEYVQS